LRLCPSPSPGVARRALAPPSSRHRHPDRPTLQETRTMKRDLFAFHRPQRPPRRPHLAVEELERRLAPSATPVLQYHNDLARTGPASTTTPPPPLLPPPRTPSTSSPRPRRHRPAPTPAPPTPCSACTRWTSRRGWRSSAW